MLYMAGILTTLPTRDDLVREVLPLLGDGGTTDVARRAVDWAIERFLPMVGERVVTELAGVNEVAGLLGTSRANVLRWSNGQGRTDMPAPVLTLSCGPHWSRSTLAAWVPADQDHQPVINGG
jgi:hypothetical protein